MEDEKVIAKSSPRKFAEIFGRNYLPQIFDHHHFCSQISITVLSESPYHGVVEGLLEGVHPAALRNGKG